MNYMEEALLKHKELKGKLRIAGADTLDTVDKRSIYYSPGVGAVSSAIAKNPELAWETTGINNTVLVVSEGSAVLGLGNIGPEAALPVMEGKCMLFKEFAGINAFPIVLKSQDPDMVVQTVEQILPSVGAVNLEDIAAPACFEIERRLKEICDKPIFHDDQHGTAIVVVAGLINAAKVVDKEFKSLKVVISGAGAAGSAIAKLLHMAGVADMVVLDSRGVIHADRDGIRDDKLELAKITNKHNLQGDLQDALKDADVFVGVSKSDLMNAHDVQLMADDAIVFGLSNPIPEIMPEEAIKGGAVVVATGRSDYPNQVNNALVFPALFRGALDNRVRQITDDHKLAAAYALAEMVEEPTAEKIIPSLDEAPEILKRISTIVV